MLDPCCDEYQGFLRRLIIFWTRSWEVRSQASSLGELLQIFLVVSNTMFLPYVTTLSVIFSLLFVLHLRDQSASFLTDISRE
jgi:hypothetical protein